MPSTILLFDLGGVLVDLGDPAGAMQLDIDNEQFWKTWLSSPLVHQFETGQLDASGFVAGFGAELGVADATDFERRLRRWQLPMYDGAEQYLRSLAKCADIALLSNTNELHWQHVQSQTDVFASFAHLFLSFETGNAKPQPAAFLDAVEYFACSPGDIVFFDDNAHNVAAATATGLRAKQVRGLAELRQAVDAFIG
jgi:putative hydrolase of the HAD superfamily